VREINAHAHGMTVDPQYVPVCPVCGGTMDVNLRINRFFVEDEHWHRAAERYEDFVNRHLGSSMVLLELGVGMNTPGIIRYPFERIVYTDREATLIRLNDSWPHGAREIADRTISFPEDMNIIIPQLAY
ncbi:MAG: hypothetical protein K2J58_05680, partial [Muribaculaceae bacterium]|nr:hypothetical protein [Muribaculaceae bacterium]